jgi:hypothetical protein
MQLIPFNRPALHSVKIATGVLASSFLFTYGTLEMSDAAKVFTDKSTLDHIIKTNNGFYNGLFMDEYLREKVRAWEKNTMLMSFANDIVSDDNFKAIVAQGRSAVPFILQEISENPSPLVWSLNIIYNKTISKENQKNITIEEACKLWIKALKK